MLLLLLENIYGKGSEQNNQLSSKTVINPSWFDRWLFSIQIVLISNDCILGLISSHAKFQKVENQTKIEGILMGLKWWYLQCSFSNYPKKALLLWTVTDGNTKQLNYFLGNRTAKYAQQEKLLTWKTFRTV